jgi:tRNA (cmo5U34)-methyltransferase
VEKNKSKLRKNLISMGKGISSVEGTWKFTDNVAKSFDKHVNQSIPHYKEIQKYVNLLAEWFLKDETIVYDLGCSTGETINTILNSGISNKLRIIGIDENRKMVKIAKSKIIRSKKNKKIKIEFKHGDITKIKSFKKSNLFISILLFPFLNIVQRKNLLKKIYKSLNYGGGFILVDKIRADHSDFEDMFNQVYFDFKIDKGLTAKQILNKSKSLRSSMYLYHQNQILSLLKESKFRKYEVFFKWFNFVGIVATK